MNDNSVGKYAELKNGTILFIDSIDNEEDVLIGRDINKIDSPKLKISSDNISRIIDEICKNIEIE